ncbi:MAG: tetratricopeptide repeat protein [Planctomycetota bacterium]
MMRTVLALLLAATIAPADVIVLLDGRVFEFDSIEKKGDDYVIRLQNGEVVVPGATVASSYGTTAEGDLVPRTEEEKKKFAKGLRPWDGKWIKKSKWDRKVAAYDEERRRRVEQMKERRLWRNHVTVETKRFTFKHTLPDPVFEEYKLLFESYYKFFTKYWKIRPSPKFGKVTINIFHDRESFQQVGGAGGGVVGYYMPLRRDLNFYVDRENRAYTIDVMFHEGNHMLSHMIDEKFWYPWWVGEGMAEYFGASEWNPRTGEMKIGLLQSGRLAVLKEQFKDESKRLKLDTLVQTRGMGAIGYAWAWSFCHFLLSTPKYEKNFKRFFLGLARARGVRRVPRGMGFLTVEGPEVKRLLLKYLKVKDIETLEREWYQYIQDVLKLTKEADVDWANAGYVMSIYGEHAKARKFFKRAIDRGSNDPFVLYGYAQLKLMQRMPGIALKYAKKAVESDALHARAWMLQGQALMAQGDTDEGMRLLKLARELDPEDQQIWFALTAAEEAARRVKEQGG